MGTTEIVLVDEWDREIGSAEKYLVHVQGLLHRAFSVFVLRKRLGRLELLLQKRQRDKYHSGGLWTNTCCGHPYPDEEIVSAGQRRLKEEMGIDVSLREVGVFHYHVSLDGGVVENELDHVLVGFFEDQPIDVNEEEVSDFCWMEVTAFQADLQKHPKKYTKWVLQALKWVLRAEGA